MRFAPIAGFVTAVLVVVATPSAHAADYYVAPGGSDAAAGTSAAPWATLQYAANRVNPGDIVHVRDGGYVGFNATRGGTAAMPVRFVGEGMDVRITTRNAVTPDGINVEGADYVTIDNFIVNGMPRTGVRCAVSRFVTIRRIRADMNARWGILTGCCPDIIIEDNVTSRSVAEHGIYFSNSADRPTIRRNTSFLNRANGIHMNGDLSINCGAVTTTDGIIRNAVVERNVIYSNGSGGGSGINCDGVSDSIIRNNLIYDALASGISLYQIDAGGPSQNNLVVNNTIIQSATGRWAINIVGGSTGNTLRNNILFTNHAFRGAIVIDAASRMGFTSNYNLLTPRLSADGDTTTLALAAWQALGYDLNSMASTAAANFVNVATNDYHLRAGVPAVDRGEATRAPPDDIEGLPRPVGAAFDIGAYEYRTGVPMDGGAPTDSGPPDSGASDTGSAIDTGSATDTGSARDTGTAMDMGPAMDTGSPSDSASPVDSGGSSDAVAMLDSPTPTDSAVTTDAGPSDGSRGDVGAEGTTMTPGCRCGVVGANRHASAALWTAVAVGALAVARRRRRQSRN